MPNSIGKFSVIIPANDEELVIGRCLQAVTGHARPGEMEVVVVCNGCKDKTASIARTFGPLVQVIETAVRSKANALNIGDDTATAFPRIYLDADIEVSTDVLRELAQMLKDGSPVLAGSPKALIDYEDRNFLVRSFYRTWTSLPYFKDGLFGAGLFAFSREGRKRFGRFPEIIADDGFARLVVEPHERKCLSEGTFKITPPRTLRGVIKINIRARAGLYELKALFPEMFKNETTNATRSLMSIVRSPELWVHAPVYLCVMLCAKAGAHYKLWRKRNQVWEKDLTSRR